MPENPPPLPDFTRWPSFPFEGELRVKRLAPPVDVEPPRSGEDAADCVACNTPDEAYIWVSERWRVRAMDRPTGLPMVLILECRSHLDLGDLPNLLAAELGVMTVRLERAVRSLDGVARVHVNRWGDGSAHLHMWFLARPYGRLQLRGTFLSLWDDILPVIPEFQWRENLAMVAAWLAEFGGRPLAEPPHIAWQSPGTYSEQHTRVADDAAALARARASSEPPEESPRDRPQDLGDVEAADPTTADEPMVGRPAGIDAADAPTRDLRASTERTEQHPADMATADQDADPAATAGRSTVAEPPLAPPTTVTDGSSDVPDPSVETPVGAAGPDVTGAGAAPVTAQLAGTSADLPPAPVGSASTGARLSPDEAGTQTGSDEAGANAGSKGTGPEGAGSDDGAPRSPSPDDLKKPASGGPSPDQV